MDIDPVKALALRRTLPRAAEKINAMASRADAAENFPQVQLGAAGLRVGVILPVEYKYPH